MKMNDDKVYAYLSGLMKGEEKLRFEQELKNSEELSRQYETIKSMLGDMKTVSETQPDEVYFSSLLPKVREKMVSKKKRRFPALVYLAPTAVAVMVLFFVFYNPVSKNNSMPMPSLSEIVANADSSITDYISDPIYPDYSYSTSKDSDVSVNLSYAEEQVSKKELLNMVVNLPVIDEYSFIDHLSDQEIERAYQSLLNKKIL